MDFELTGFQTVKREGIRVVINQTLSVDQQLQVATLQETVTVTGESPVVDTTTTTMGTNFTKELLTEIPNARDVWAAMAQAPGMQMTAYDVGGSRTGNQTGYRTYGMDDQNQTRLEGIDTTEATNANAGYFDFGSFEEFQVGGAGADASAFAGGAVLSISVKSGSDRLTGNWYSDYQNEDMIANNVPDYLQVANERNEDGYFTRTPLAARQPDPEAVRPQRQHRRAVVARQDLGLLQLPAERPVQVHDRPAEQHRALEADQPVHLQAHLPGDRRTIS